MLKNIFHTESVKFFFLGFKESVLIAIVNEEREHMSYGSWDSQHLQVHALPQIVKRGNTSAVVPGRASTGVLITPNKLLVS